MTSQNYSGISKGERWTTVLWHKDWAGAGALKHVTRRPNNHLSVAVRAGPLAVQGWAFTHILPVLTGKNVLTDKGYKAKNAMIQYNVFQVESLQNLHSNTKQ